MRLLLDTHAFLWLVTADPRLSTRAQDCFLDPINDVLLSDASYWEICIKISLGKLSLGSDWVRSIDREVARLSIRWLGIERSHLLGVAPLPLLHRDPFDRLLVAQAIHERLAIVTSDQNIARYQVSTIW